MLKCLCYLRRHNGRNEDLRIVLEKLNNCDETCDTDEGQDEHIKFMKQFFDYFISNLALPDKEFEEKIQELH